MRIFRDESPKRLQPLRAHQFKCHTPKVDKKNDTSNACLCIATIPHGQRQNPQPQPDRVQAVPTSLNELKTGKIIAEPSLTHRSARQIQDGQPGEQVRLFLDRSPVILLIVRRRHEFPVTAFTVCELAKIGGAV